MKSTEDLEHYKTDLKKRFPAAFASYESFRQDDKPFLQSCLEFFESNKIIISCYQVFGSPKYSGTWTAKIVIDNPGAVLALGRKRIAFPTLIIVPDRRQCEKHYLKDSKLLTISCLER
jgi:hypothetical protein